jgi:hypothetical protein
LLHTMTVFATALEIIELVTTTMLLPVPVEDNTPTVKELCTTVQDVAAPELKDQPAGRVNLILSFATNMLVNCEIVTVNEEVAPASVDDGTIDAAPTTPVVMPDKIPVFVWSRNVSTPLKVVDVDTTMFVACDCTLPGVLILSHVITVFTASLAIGAPTTTVIVVVATSTVLLVTVMAPPWLMVHADVPPMLKVHNAGKTKEILSVAIKELDNGCRVMTKLPVAPAVVNSDTKVLVVAPNAPVVMAGIVAVVVISFNTSAAVKVCTTISDLAEATLVGALIFVQVITVLILSPDEIAAPITMTMSSPLAVLEETITDAP